ncbi:MULTISPECIES: DUF7314 family protein [Halobacteriales]|jgi:hypothetical protein|uniref:DUF7314 domain-containing protein n=13 Tax=Haloarcula TaxID=2237 RepID=Q5V430_HALMA|nr:MULTISPECIES: hypothetical protein [Haloarcula]AAV45722.1 unknown [Haloarcula marismortui ATCC 43049]AEM56990.1 conserved hypothetical protein [Haloarcula hispanica ATCC 33960]AHB65781.1 hypothetical protein HISP_07045 [Haloarcula hispanica N601]AJF26922.1 hypothetical protein SG26_14880 [Haloarcula sp. CBA1115]AUG47232.1 hypothetical protein BVU17_06705 [Haloarcula taiwanensis]
MADEFMKGFACLMVGGLGWMTIKGWYNTPSFEGAQLTGELTIEEPTTFDQIALFMGDAFFWFAVLGALTFWVVLPLISEFQAYLNERSA